MKEVNRYTSNEFHDWQRKNLPRHFVLQDIDTWALVWTDSATHHPIALVELKRSYIAPDKWTPFEADAPNYKALFQLADRAKLALWIIYFQKDKPIEDGSQFRVFLVRGFGGAAWIQYEDKLMTSKEFATKFPSIF